MRRAGQESLWRSVGGRGRGRGRRWTSWLGPPPWLLLALLCAGSCQDGGSGQSCVEQPDSCTDGQRCSAVSQRCEPAAGPVLTGVSPSLGPTAGGLELVLTGERFAAGATVRIDGVAATQVRVVSETQLVATLPARPGALGPVPVEVQDPAGPASSRSDLFSYFASRLAFPQPRFAAGALAYAVAVADFDGDGKADMAVANGGGASVSVLTGDGQGGFAAQRTFAAGAQPLSVAVGDFNRDGRVDLAVSDLEGTGVSVLLNLSR